MTLIFDTMGLFSTFNTITFNNNFYNLGLFFKQWIFKDFSNMLNLNFFFGIFYYDIYGILNFFSLKIALW